MGGAWGGGIFDIDVSTWEVAIDHVVDVVFSTCTKPNPITGRCPPNSQTPCSITYPSVQSTLIYSFLSWGEGFMRSIPPLQLKKVFLIVPRYQAWVRPDGSCFFLRVPHEFGLAAHDFLDMVPVMSSAHGFFERIFYKSFVGSAWRSMDFL